MANKSIPRIEGILQYYSRALGDDYNAYRNHVYRVYHLSLVYLKQDLNTYDQEVLAVASAFHDLGLWSHKTMDYLGPSINLCQQYLAENNMMDQYETIKCVIDHHHKISAYKGESQALTEAFRKADLADLSLGLISFNLPKSIYTNLKEEFPFLGFHRLISAKVLRHALRHPLTPFPMIKS
ncbi:MAG: hypothetical protein OCD76_22580 [Reichenbachiella sp.]